MHFYFVELGDFNKGRPELGTFEEKVYFCLKRIGIMDSKPEEFTDEFFDELFSVTEFESLTSEQRLEYLRNMDSEEKKERQIAGALEQGIEQGIRQGIEKGRNSMAMEMAKHMLSDGHDIAFVSKYTGLTADCLEAFCASIPEC